VQALADLPAFCSKHLQESIWVEGEWLELRPVNVLCKDRQASWQRACSQLPWAGSPSALLLASV
jgi:hypothetical protein